MKQILSKTSSVSHNRSVKVLEILVVLSFASITYDDSKFEWPIIIWATGALLVGSPTDKLTYLPVFLSWLYLWGVVFKANLYRRIITLIAIGALWIIVILQGYWIFSDTKSETINRNHWFIGSSISFLLISALLFVFVLRQRSRG